MERIAICNTQCRAVSMLMLRRGQFRQSGRMLIPIQLPVSNGLTDLPVWLTRYRQIPSDHFHPATFPQGTAE